VRGSALIVCAWLTAGCNAPTCGPGTTLVGDQCETISTGDGGACDGDAFELFDPTLGVCVSGDPGHPGPPPCPLPIPAGSVCITGGVVDLATSRHLPTDGTARPLRIGVYEPLSVFSNPNVAPLAEETSSTRGSFTFTIPAPASGLAVVVRDPQGETPTDPLAVGAVGASVFAGYRYQIDAFMVKKSLLDNWSAADPAFLTEGSVVDCFYDIAPGAATNFVFDESAPPASGVQLVAGGMMPLVARYLKPDATIDSALTSTGSHGCAVAAGGSSYSFQGGGVSQWEKKWSATTTSVVFVQGIKSCDGAPSGTPSCN
jgi:hypothetical protein